MRATRGAGDGAAPTRPQGSGAHLTPPVEPVPADQVDRGSQPPPRAVAGVALHRAGRHTVLDGLRQAHDTTLPLDEVIEEHRRRMPRRPRPAGPNGETRPMIVRTGT